MRAKTLSASWAFCADVLVRIFADLSGWISSYVRTLASLEELVFSVEELVFSVAELALED
jgi:hypothetical protein